MTGNTILVEWALQGKTLGRAGARVLACSNGKLSRENFTELLGRFSLGTPDELPQMSVSYLTSGHPPGRAYYLGMAIHEWASNMHTDDGELLERDDDNRPVAVTTYFCVPYQPLADTQVSYEAMYQEFNNLRLSTESGPPLRVEFPVRTGLPAISPLVMQSASRLLAGRKVCVLGAESTSVAERLEFIGAVAALLPYGYRTRLAAATWVRPTHRGHRFRLFFSTAMRDAKPPDDVVWWGDPERTALTRDDDYAYTYDRWLADTIGPLEDLARLKTPRSFTHDEVIQSLGEIGLPAREPDEPEPAGPVQERRAWPTLPLLVRTRDLKFDGEQILRDCASYLEPLDVTSLTIAITRLEAWAKSRSGISPEERYRYQAIIKEWRLFRHDERDESLSPRLETRMRAALLRVAFIRPLSYQAYGIIEDSLGAEAPDEALLQLIVNAGMSDMQIKAVVFGQLLRRREVMPEINKKMDDWYKSKSDQANAAQLIDAVAGPWHRARHALWASRTIADLMTRIGYEPAFIERVLRPHGYLAHALQTAGHGHDNTQVYVLLRFLVTAHPNRLSAHDIQQILIERTEPPSPALLAAVLLWLGDSYDAHLAREAYVFGTIRAMNLKQDTREALRPCLAFVDEGSGGPAVGQGYHPATDPT